MSLLDHLSAKLSAIAAQSLTRKLRTAKSRLIAAGVIGLAFLYCWAELAVGIFTNLGS